MHVLERCRSRQVALYNRCWKSVWISPESKLHGLTNVISLNSLCLLEELSVDTIEFFFILLLYYKNRCRIDEILFVQHENVESPENFVFLILWVFFGLFYFYSWNYWNMFSNLIVFISCTEIALFCSEINKKLRGLISFYCYTILHKLFSLISNPVYRILQLKILYCIGKTFLKSTNP